MEGAGSFQKCPSSILHPSQTLPIPKPLCGSLPKEVSQAAQPWNTVVPGLMGMQSAGGAVQTPTAQPAPRYTAANHTRRAAPSAHLLFLGEAH